MKDKKFWNKIGIFFLTVIYTISFLKLNEFIDPIASLCIAGISISIIGLFALVVLDES